MNAMPSRLRGGAPPPLPPRKPSHLQHMVHGSRQAKYNCSCGDNTKANICSCSTCHTILRNDDSPCSYFGRCVEPLAWNIENEPITNQAQSPLFTTLPRELRDLVFEYALTDCKADSFEDILRRNASRIRIKPNESSPKHDIAINLLRTCRAVYFEAWTLPLSLNPYIVYDLHAPARSGVKLHEFLPWQLALIQSLDITLQQVALEGNTLHNYFHKSPLWQPDERHQGVYIAPRRYKTAHRGPRALTEYPASFNFALLPAHETQQQRHFLSHILGTQQRHPESLPPPWSSAMRVTTAKPLTHLTLRLQHSDWWTWSDHPESTIETQHLGLDPAVGDGSAEEMKRPTATRMRALAERRRAGYHPEVPDHQGWISTIGMLPDLKRLDLVLETFKAKEKQLDAVTEAAKLWRFPITGTQWELVWDGEMGMSGWSFGKDEWQGTGHWRGNPGWHGKAKEFSVRKFGFVRRRAM
ncbi:hypothetical protein CC86DRAFT_471487 [Ophiobolus disseminans]|uniref:F-box domain-containing protein n=1 Tax=Ophiobolus disseminans TaxID=1469910 RepID=A0A6A6ZH03_9PLEO|nr:hypothetical protein CC86DRAFT_471487 [Ophiobolus disseminans]